MFSYIIVTQTRQSVTNQFISDAKCHELFVFVANCLSSVSHKIDSNFPQRQAEKFLTTKSYF